jgi:monofunctional biosynthetic peptidoglycan transglycosylase
VLKAVSRWLVRLLLLAALLVLALQFWFAGWIAWWRWNDPQDTAFMRRALAELRERNPKAELKHRWVPYERISPHLKRAVVTAEDARFAEHEGVDWEAIEKALKDNARRGSPRGGSTITQQLAKNLFLTPERSYLRKGQELVITYMIEAIWDKRRILEVYLNVVEWGEGIFGAEAAARHYYGIPAAALGPEQSARLAAYLPNPKRYGRARAGPYLDGRTAAILRYMPDAVLP